MPVLEIVLAGFAAFGALLDVSLSVFNLCMQGTCRSECCCVEVEHKDSESARSSSPPPTTPSVSFSPEALDLKLKELG